MCIAPTLHWLAGLPCIGKTTLIRPACLNAGLPYVEADLFREDAWHDYQLSSPKRPDTDRWKFATYRAAYIEVIRSTADFVALHDLVAPFLFRRVEAYVREQNFERAVVEVSSLYDLRHAASENVIFVATDTTNHQERIAKRLKADAGVAEGIFWRLKSAERRLFLRHNRSTDPFDVNEKFGILEKLL